MSCVSAKTSTQSSSANSCFVCGRYLRPTADSQQPPACGDSPPDPNTTSSGDECSNSAATSGEEVWGTPTSGGELDEELMFPSAVSVRLCTEQHEFSKTAVRMFACVGDATTELEKLIFSAPFCVPSFAAVAVVVVVVSVTKQLATVTQKLPC